VRATSPDGEVGAARRRVDPVDDDHVDGRQTLDGPQPPTRADHEVVGERQKAHGARADHGVDDGRERAPHPPCRHRPQSPHHGERIGVEAMHAAAVQVENADVAQPDGSQQQGKEVKANEV